MLKSALTLSISAEGDPIVLIVNYFRCCHANSGKTSFRLTSTVRALKLCIAPSILTLASAGGGVDNQKCI